MSYPEFLRNSTRLGLSIAPILDNAILPIITKQPVSILGSVDDVVTFSVEASNYESISWYKGGLLVGTGSSLNLTVTALDFDVIIYCVVSNLGQSVQSKNVFVRDTDLFMFTTQPQSVVKSIGDSSTFTVDSNYSDLPIQWYMSGTYIGAGNKNLTIEILDDTPSAEIYCTIGGISSDIVTLTVQRYFSTLDPVTQGHYTLQNPKTFAGDFEWIAEVSTSLNNLSYVFIVGRHQNDRVYLAIRNGLLIFGNGGTFAEIVGALISDGKLHKVSLKVVAGLATVRLDGVVVKAEALTGTLPVTISEVGRRTDGVVNSYWSGVIANVTLTDLSNPSNSESWKLGNPTGVNTEQSSLGNNLLTYVNVTNRELFTKVGNDWLGVERVLQPINLIANWLPTGAGIITSPSKWDSTAAGGVRTGPVSLQGRRLKISGEITAGGAAVDIKDSSTGQGVDPSIITLNPTGHQVFSNVYFSTQDGIYLRSAGASANNTLHNVSVKRILEVA